jgi:DNA repair protein RadA/Sms
MEPDLLIVDSIQTVSTEVIESTPGSVGQIRECTNAILKYAKEDRVPVLLIGHITKDGNLAGPKVLEHIVDTVLQFEGENQYMYRILRASQNRFGSTSELGIFEMGNLGLREVSNPSELLISRDPRRTERHGYLGLRRRGSSPAHRNPGTGKHSGLRHSATIVNRV